MVVACQTGNDRAGSLPDKPDMLAFLADDFSLADATIYAPTAARTPTLTALASRGMIFERAFVASPACAPSRSSLFTGMLPERNGVTGNHDYSRREGVTSLAHDLTAQGYDVAIFGKVAHIISSPREEWDYGVTHAGSHKLDFAEVETYLRERDSSRPLALFIGTHYPHVPWIREVSDFDPETVNLPVKAVDTPQTRINRAQYYEAVEAMDEDLATALALTDTYLGLDDMPVFFSSDHGAQWPFAKWNLYDESVRVPFVAAWPGVVDEGSRNRAMISWIDLFPTLIDIAGGQTDLQHPVYEGRPFTGVLTGREDRHRDIILTSHTGDTSFNVYPIRSARTENLLYIRNLYPQFVHTTHIDKAGDKWTNEYWKTWVEAAQTDPQAQRIVSLYRRRPAEELYDLASDPAQLANVIDDPAYLDEAERLRAAVDRYMADHDDKGELSAEPVLPADLPEKEVFLR